MLDTSPFLSSILKGNMLPDFECMLNGRAYMFLYFLADGIYPHWSIFVSTISEPLTKKEVQFSAAQEAVRKDVGRALGVLLSRWNLLEKPGKLWDRDRSGKVLKCAIILRNMIVKARHNGYKRELFELANMVVSKRFFLMSMVKKSLFSGKLGTH